MCLWLELPDVAAYRVQLSANKAKAGWHTALPHEQQQRPTFLPTRLTGPIIMLQNEKNRDVESIGQADMSRSPEAELLRVLCAQQQQQQHSRMHTM